MTGTEKEKAAQFLPFNGLLGFYQLIGKKKREKEPKRELSDDQLLRLDRILKTIHPKDRARVVFYDGCRYEAKEGVVKDINLCRKTLTIGHTMISFKDVWNLQKQEKHRFF
jgi:hypothetical protein